MTSKREERLQILTQTDLPLWQQGICFAGMDEAEIEKGLAALKKAWM